MSRAAVVCLLCLGLARLPAAAEVGERSPTRVGKPRRRASGPRGRRRQPRADLPSGIAQRSAYARVGGPRGGDGANASRRVVWPLRGTGRTYVHVVGTRFCLKQGHEAALVEARLLLFERICVPTMAQQSTDRFVWLVVVDETLAPRHRLRLKTILEAYRGPKDFRVVALDRLTNSDLRAQGHHAFGLARLHPFNMEADYVLTTVLDADDGLPYQALRMIREQVADAVRRVQRDATLREHKLVAVACYTDAFNWQPSTRRPAGALNLHNESMCITPGLTRVVPFSRPMALGNSSLSRHALLKSRWPGAKTCTQRSSRNAVAIPIRSRTATSNGMRDVVRAADVPASDVYRWRPVLQAQFNITTGDLKATNKGLTLNEAAIARAQMRSNCHDGWSCKEVALAKLRDMSRGARRLLLVGPGRRGRLHQPSHAGHCRHWMLTETVA
mmetsp:Transcript_11951/g.31415  ORF Transcript_11951/g.31415 Transcript_11951/m.31415 type:complete len:443 (-) Transcript_11951:105-1433(-)